MCLYIMYYFKQHFDKKSTFDLLVKISSSISQSSIVAVQNKLNNVVSPNEVTITSKYISDARSPISMVFGQFSYLCS